VPRSYEHSLPKKVRRAALRGALSLKLREGGLRIVEALDLDGYRTKRMIEILRNLGADEGGTLIVIEEASPFVESSARNLPGVSVVRAPGLNVYDVLRHRQLVMTRAGLSAIERRLGDGSEESQT
jgi:large subunit ribosomal protein L4